MSQKSPQGINSWLEDELYQQYLHDRSTVDESWKDVFESSPVRQNNGEPPAAAKPAAPPTPPPAPDAGSGEQLQPLRGAAGRIAENMAACVAIPLATSQRTIAVKVMDENRRIINQHRTLVGRQQGLLHSHHRLGHRPSTRGYSRPQSRLRRTGRPALPRRSVSK